MGLVGFTGDYTLERKDVLCGGLWDMWLKEVEKDGEICWGICWGMENMRDRQLPLVFKMFYNY